MKFSLTFAASALVVAAQAKMLKQETEDQGVDLDTDSTTDDFWSELSSTVFYARNAYLGAYQGLYSMTTKSQVVKPDNDCFGEWIPEKLKKVELFADHVLSAPWDIRYEEASSAGYAWVDLLFLNDEYCHFRGAFWDLYTFCDDESNCSFDAITSNM